MKVIRRILFWSLAVVLGVPLLAAVLVLGALQLEPVRERILEAGTEALRGQGIDAELVGLQGMIPVSLALTRLSLSDVQGPWLELSDLRFSWRPSELFRGRIWVEELAVGSLRLERLPSPGPETEPEPEPAQQEPFKLPSGLPGLVLEKIELRSLKLGPTIVGESMELELMGHGQAPAGGEMGLDLSLRRIDQTTADLGLKLGFDPARERLRLDLALDESGGLIERLSGLALNGPVHLGLRGKGAVGDWPGELELSLPGAVALGSKLRIGLTQPQSLGVDAQLRLAEALVGADAATLLGEEVSLALQLELANEQRIQLESLEIGALAASIEGHGELDLEAREIRLDVRAVAQDLGVLESLAGQPLTGSAVLDVGARGPMLQPTVEARLGVEGLSAGELRVAAVETRADLVLDGPLGDGAPRGSLKIDGGLSGLRVPADLPADRVQWGALAELGEQGVLKLASVTVDAGVARIRADGELDVNSLAGHLRLDGQADDLARLTAATGAPVSGGLKLEGRADFGAGFGQIDANARMAFSGLRGLPPEAQALLGPDPGLRLEARAEGGSVRVSAVQLHGAEVDLSGAGNLEVDEDRLDFRVELEIPRLAALQSADIPVAGNLSADIAVSGRLSDPAATLELTVDQLVAAERKLESLRAEIAAKQLLSSPSGRIRLAAGPASQRLALSSELNQKGQTLSIPTLELTAPGTRLAGSMDVSLGDGRVNGRLAGGIEDLQKLQFWLQDPTLGGAVELDARLQSGDRQALEVKAVARGVHGGFGSLKKADIAALVGDLNRLDGIQARVDLERLEVGEWAVPILEIRADGNVERLVATTNLTVEGAEQGSLSTRLEVARQGSKHLVSVDSLDGTWAEHPLHSDRKARIEVGDGSLRLTDLDLALGPGRVSGDASYGSLGVNARLSLEQIPLDLARAFLPNINGEASAALELSGPLARPSVSVDLDVDDLTVEDKDLESVPAARIRGKATLAAGHLKGDLSIERLTDQPLRAEYQIPFRLALEPFAAELPADAPLHISFVGDADLARLSRFVELDDQRLAGLLHASLRVEGSSADPLVKGQVEVREARYENGFTGTLIDDLELRAEAIGRGVRVKQLTATDGAAGRLAVTGEASWDSAGALSYAADLQLDEATLIRHSDAQATIAGKVSARGTPEAGRVTGEVRVTRAELRIPDRIPPSIPTLEVKEVYADGEPALEPAKAAGAEAPIDLDLQIVIPSRFFVRGRGLESEWKGKLDVKGTVTSPLVLGNLEVERGRFDFIDKRFTLEEGKIEFYGTKPPQPDLKFRATAPGRDMVGVLNVSGPPDDLKLALESEPPMPQDEVLARLLFDRELNEVSGLQALRIALAVRELSGQGGTDGILDGARGSLGLDTLDVGGGGSEGATVKAGKYLEEDIYLEVESGLGGEGSRVRVEKDLLRNLSVEASVDQQSNSGFGINWKMDY